MVNLAEQELQTKVIQAVQQFIVVAQIMVAVAVAVQEPQAQADLIPHLAKQANLEVLA